MRAKTSIRIVNALGLCVLAASLNGFSPAHAQHASVARVPSKDYLPAQPQPWTSVGSAGTVDPSDLSLVQMVAPGRGEVTFHPSRFGTARIQYNVTMLGQCGPLVVLGPVVLTARFLDHGSGEQVVASLKQYNLTTGDTTTLITLDSDAHPGTDEFQVQSASSNHSLDFVNNSYFVGVELTRTHAHPLPSLRFPADSQLSLPRPALAMLQIGGPPVSCFVAYTTAYGYPDNSPPGTNIAFKTSDYPALTIHDEAGGMGTAEDPITIAVGWSRIGGLDIPDFGPGTRFYLPNLRRYFIVEDECGNLDLSQVPPKLPQDGPCHKVTDLPPYPPYIQFDLWVGGKDTDAPTSCKQNPSSPICKCEDDITGLHLIIMNPPPNYAVVEGSIYNSDGGNSVTGHCSIQFGDTVQFK